MVERVSVSSQHCFFLLDEVVFSFFKAYQDKSGGIYLQIKTRTLLDIISVYPGTLHILKRKFPFQFFLKIHNHTFFSIYSKYYFKSCRITLPNPKV